MVINGFTYHHCTARCNFHLWPQINPAFQLKCKFLPRNGSLIGRLVLAAVRGSGRDLPTKEESYGVKFVAIGRTGDQFRRSAVISGQRCDHQGNHCDNMMAQALPEKKKKIHKDMIGIKPCNHLKQKLVTWLIKKASIWFFLFFFLPLLCTSRQPKC